MNRLHISPTQKIYLTQFSVMLGEKIVYLPYSVGCVWAYAEQQLSVARSQLGGIWFIKRPIAEYLAELDNPALVGFSNYVWNSNYNDQMAQAIKQKWPNCVIVYGGPNVPDQPGQWYKDRSYVDVCIHKEGELTFNSLVNGTPLLMIPGISYKDSSGKWNHNTDASRIDQLDHLPSPYVQGLFNNLLDKNYVINGLLETDRGCPFKCTFCDWGGVTFSKLKKINIERVFAEIDWLGQNQISNVTIVNANFGIFADRDSTISDYIIATNKKYGYPKTIDFNWAKNSNDLVFDIALRFKRAGMLHKFGVSMQSMNTETLINIKRDNMGINDFDDVVTKAHAHDMQVMVELIAGLPGETYDTWTENFCKLMSHENTSIESYPCWLLYNSELTSAESVQKFKIQSRTLPYQSYARGYVQEEAQQVIATSTLPEQDLIQLWQWTWCANLGHTLGLVNHISKHVCSEQNCSTKEFYENWYRYIKNSNGILNEKYMHWQQLLDQYNFIEYTGNFDYMQDIGYLRRQETMQDLKLFVETYWPHCDSAQCIELFDINYFTPDYQYPRQQGQYHITHGGTGDVARYSDFIRLSRKNKGWRCQVSIL